MRWLMLKPYRHARNGRRATKKSAFTLVEILVVLLLLLLLASIALPVFKNLLLDQKASRCARGVIGFFDLARSRAISENRSVGVRIERLGSSDPFGRATSIRLRQLVGVPPYSGDAADAVALLQSTSGTFINSAQFSAQDSPLLWLSSSILNNTDSSDDHLAPIQIGDHFELPGGRSVPIISIAHTAATITISFDLEEKSGTIPTFPGAIRDPNLAAGDPVKYRIHRRPVPSSTATYDLLPGLAIDLNFSGVGIDNNDFHPDTMTSVAAQNVDIIFAPDGSVESVTDDMVTSDFAPPISHIYLCLGKLDGVIPYQEDLFQDDSRGTSNIMSLDSIWLKLNPSTGRIVASPFARVVTIPAIRDEPGDAGVDTAVEEARSLAQVSATLDSEP